VRRNNCLIDVPAAWSKRKNSGDNGKNWIFFDASNSGMLKPTDIMPNLSPALTIPAKKQQVEGETR